MPPQLKPHIHVTKSAKRDNIYKLCLWMPEKHDCLKTSSILAKNANLSYIPQDQRA